jgi:hypothetical protein
MAPRNDDEHLRAAWQSLSASTAPDGWRVIRIGASRRAFAGVRFPSAIEGLLIGFNVDLPAAKDLPDGRGFAVEKLAEPATAEFRSWIGLSRRGSAGLDMFALMAADLLETAESHVGNSGDDELRLCQQFIARVRSWQRFMERPADGRLTDDEEVGLFGELSFVVLLLDAGFTPSDVVDIWLGPQNGLRDFMGEGFAVEVKSTVAVNGFPAKIASLEQLDNAQGEDISLVAFRLALQSDGVTLSELVDQLRTLIAGPAQSGFERKLVLAGYSNAHATSYSRKFATADLRSFAVTSGFPRLSRSSIPLAIRDAEYIIDLDLVPVAADSTTDLIRSLLAREAR